MFSMRRSEFGVGTGVTQVRAPFLSCMQAALRVGEVRHCGGFTFEVYHCVQGEVGDCREQLLFSSSWCGVFQGMLSLPVVVSDERTSSKHEAVPLPCGVLYLSVRPSRSVASVSFQFSWHVFCVNVAMSRYYGHFVRTRTA